MMTTLRAMSSLNRRHRPVRTVSASALCALALMGSAVATAQGSAGGSLTDGEGPAVTELEYDKRHMPGARAGTIVRPGPEVVYGVETPAVPSFGSSIDSAISWGPNAENTCDPVAKPGVVAFEKLLHDTYDANRWSNIVRSCSGKGTSGHHAGRSLDWSSNFKNAEQKAQADTLVSWLVAPDEHGNPYAMARRFGLMYIIWNDQVFKLYRPSAGWTEYNGCYDEARQSSSNDTFCHRDHIHFSFTWEGARAETSYFQAVDVPAAPDPSPSPTPTSTPTPTPTSKPSPTTPACSAVLSGTSPATSGPAGFVPIAPARVLDTRFKTGVPDRCRATPGSTFDVPVTGLSGIAAGKAAAVALNVTVTGGSGPGWVAVHPAGREWGGSSTVNYVAGSDMAAQVIVPVGAGDAVTVVTGVSDVDVVMDVTGYFPADGSGAGFTPIRPTRAYDDLLSARSWKQIPLHNVPEGAVAAVTNVTGVNPSSRSFLTATPKKPSGGGAPSVSSLNPGSGRATANRALLGVSEYGLWMYANAKQRAILDVSGWFSSSGELKYTPVGPTRVVDSREAGASVKELSAGSPRKVTLRGVAGVPAGARAVAVSVTLDQSTHPTFATVWSSGAKPGTSDVNVVAGQPQSNLVIVSLDEYGKALFDVGYGRADVIVDVLGYFA